MTRPQTGIIEYGYQLTQQICDAVFRPATHTHTARYYRQQYFTCLYHVFISRVCMSIADAAVVRANEALIASRMKNNTPTDIIIQVSSLRTNDGPTSIRPSATSQTRLYEKKAVVLGWRSPESVVRVMLYDGGRRSLLQGRLGQAGSKTSKSCA